MTSSIASTVAEIYIDEILQYSELLLKSQMAPSSLACCQPGVFHSPVASAEIWDSLNYFKYIWNLSVFMTFIS